MGVDIANGAWSSPNYSDLIIGYHTGIRIGAAYGGTRFYANSPTTDTNNTGHGNGGEALIFTVGGAAGTNDTKVEGIGYAGESFRAPIFYDSNDTNYYVNPGVTSSNSTSHSARFRQSVQIGDSSVYNQNDGGWGARLIVSDDVHAKIDVAQDANSMRSSWYCHTGHAGSYFGTITGHHQYLVSHNANRQILYSGYSEEQASYRAPTFYASNDTNAYFDSAKLVLRSGDPTIYFRDTSHRSVALHNNSNRFYVLGAPVDSTTYTQVSGVWPWYVQLDTNNVYTGNIGYAGNSYRAPIFYDSNDTNYYVDPSSTSVFSKIWCKGSSANSAPRWDTSFHVVQSQHFYGHSSTQPLYFGESNPATFGSTLTVAGDILVNGGHGGINLSDSSIVSSRVSAWTGNPGTEGKIQYHSARWYIVSDSASDRIVQFRRDGSDVSYIDNAGRLMGAPDLRVPIYYDTNTAYYGDFASNSHFNTISSAGGLLFGSDYGVGVTGLYTSSRIQTIFNMGAAYKLPNNGASTSNAYGLYWSHQNAGSVGGANNLASHGIIILEAGNYKGSWGGGRLVTPGDVRSPLFYDSNNTGYYVNPDSTSRLLNLDFGVSGYYLKAGDWGMRNQTPYGYIQFGPANTSHAHIYTDRSNFYFNQQIQVLGSSQINQNDIRSKIFYDIQNSGYYVDPASTTVVNDFRCDIMYDKDSTGYYIRPGSTSITNDFRATIFYARENTTYYTRPHTSSYINSLHTAGSIQAGNSGTSNIYMGGTSGSHFRFHCHAGASYFDMNAGNINWRQGSSTRFIFYSTTANMTVYGTVTQHSDLRIKDNVVEIPNCIDKVKSIRGIYYNRTDFNTEPTKIGVVAQEVEVEMPELVHDEETSGIKSVSYTELTAVLVNAIKEQQTIIDDLKTRLETLENQ